MRPPDLFLDICLRPVSLARQGHFAETELHGEPRVVIDKEGLVKSVPLDRQELSRRIDDRLEQLSDQRPFVEGMAEKELRRGRPLDAFAFYFSSNLRPLVEALRIRFCPERYNFGLRYLEFDLPADVVSRLGDLLYVESAEELADKARRCREWLDDELEAIRAERS